MENLSFTDGDYDNLDSGERKIEAAVEGWRRWLEQRLCVDGKVANESLVRIGRVDLRSGTCVSARVTRGKEVWCKGSEAGGCACGRGVFLHYV